MKKNNSFVLVIVILCLIGGGAYLYFDIRSIPKSGCIENLKKSIENYGEYKAVFKRAKFRKSRNTLEFGVFHKYSKDVELSRELLENLISDAIVHCEHDDSGDINSETQFQYRGGAVAEGVHGGSSLMKSSFSGKLSWQPNLYVLEDIHKKDKKSQ